MTYVVIEHFRQGGWVKRIKERRVIVRIYVGNLSYSTTEEELTKLFSEFGAVESAAVVTDKYSGRSRGFGFIEMPDAEGKAAIEALNGTESGGRTLTVNEARPRAEGGGGGGGRGGGGGGYGGGGRGGGGGGGYGGGGGGRY